MHDFIFTTNLFIFYIVQVLINWLDKYLITDRDEYIRLLYSSTRVQNFINELKAQEEIDEDINIRDEEFSIDCELSNADRKLEQSSNNGEVVVESQPKGTDNLYSDADNSNVTFDKRSIPMLYDKRNHGLEPKEHFNMFRPQVFDEEDKNDEDYVSNSKLIWLIIKLYFRQIKHNKDQDILLP